MKSPTIAQIASERHSFLSHDPSSHQRLESLLRDLAASAEAPESVRKLAMQAVTFLRQLATYKKPDEVLSELDRLLDQMIAAEFAPPSTRVFEIPSDVDMELLEEFRVESADLMGQAERALKTLAGDPSDIQSLHALFRAFHTIKGVAGFMGLTHITNFAHTAESFLDSFRRGRHEMLPSDVSLARQAVAMLKSGLFRLDETISTGRFVSSPEWGSLLHRLEHPEPAQSSPTESVELAAAEFEIEKTIRIPASRLDHLSRLIEELTAASCSDIFEIKKIAQALAEQSASLHKIPLEQTFQKMARLLRDLAHHSRKEIRLESVGGDIELDHRLIEKISAPLLHMIRNAADHGIELPHDRERLGKSRQGCVHLQAFREDSLLVISLADDGRGLDQEKILSKAIERGFSKDTAPSDDDIHRLIFLPGFSTVEDITELSGRGVGLDIVRSAVEQLHGTVEVNSRTGHGTEFRIYLPLNSSSGV